LTPARISVAPDATATKGGQLGSSVLLDSETDDAEEHRITDRRRADRETRCHSSPERAGKDEQEPLLIPARRRGVSGNSAARLVLHAYDSIVSDRIPTTVAD
jgi:hypothetical protein